MSDPSLCDEQVYQHIYIDEAEKLRNHLYYKCGDMELALDILQDSFVKLWRKCAEVIFNTVKGFLYTAAGNQLMDHFRSKKVALSFEKQPLPERDIEDPYYLLRTEEFRQHIEQCISALPDGQREAFLMNRIDQLTYKEISERIGISQTAVEKRMTKALMKLRSQIEEFKQHGV